MSAIAFQPFVDYAVRPGLCQGESLVGYVYRYLSTNGYRLTIDQDIVLERICNKKPDIVEKHFNYLKQALEGVWYIQLKGWQKSLKFKWRCVDKWGDQAKVQLGFCPRCVKLRGYHLSFWELPLVKACPEHGCCLLNACSHCGRAFNWRGLLPGFECGCGKSIGEMAYVEAEAKWLNLARKLASASDVAVPYGMDRHVSPLFALRGYKLQEIYAKTGVDLKFREPERDDEEVISLLLPLTRRLARERGIDIDFEAELAALL